MRTTQASTLRNGKGGGRSGRESNLISRCEVACWFLLSGGRRAKTTGIEWTESQSFRVPWTHDVSQKGHWVPVGCPGPVGVELARSLVVGVIILGRVLASEKENVHVAYMFKTKTIVLFWASRIHASFIEILTLRVVFLLATFSFDSE